VILIDNTVLSNYAIVGGLQILRSFCGGRGMTTDAVLSEFQAEFQREADRIAEMKARYPSKLLEKLGGGSA